jgi:hypothetical protein
MSGEIMPLQSLRETAGAAAPAHSSQQIAPLAGRPAQVGARQRDARFVANGLDISLCLEQDIDVQALATQALAQVFTQQALVLTALSADLAVLPVPSLGAWLPGRQIDRLIEDLALCSTQLADLLWDHVHAIAMVAQAPTPRPGAALVGLAYGPRVHSAMTILRRAEGWLETVDHETGADVRLPGFAPGEASLQNLVTIE